MHWKFNTCKLPRHCTFSGVIAFKVEQAKEIIWRQRKVKYVLAVIINKVFLFSKSYKGNHPKINLLHDNKIY